MIDVSDESLRRQARTFLWENRRKEYLQARRDGEMEEWIELKVRATKRYATSLIASGEMPEQAWYRAVCLEICERETD